MKSDNEFDELVSAVSDIMDVPEKDILDIQSRVGAKARRFICHIIYHALVNCHSVYLRSTKCTRASFFNNVAIADKEIHTDVESRSMMNEIRRRFGLVPLRHAVKYRPTIPATRTIFGFDYTETDELRFRNACRGAREYMKKLCSIGRKPIPAGMVFSPIRPKPTYNSWYKE